MTCLRPARTGSPAFVVHCAARVSRLLWFMCAAGVALAAAAVARCVATGEQQGLIHFFRYQGSLFLIGFAAAEYLLAVIAWRLFERGEPMRTAWLFIMAASACRLVGLMAANLLNALAGGDALAPRGAAAAPAAPIHELGLTVGSPLSMALLAAGLFVVLRLYRKLGLLRRPTLWDSFPLMIVGVFLAAEVYLLLNWLGILTGPVPALKGLSSIADLLLGLFLLEAVLVRRSALQMEGGLIGQCWSAYSLAIFLTAVGDMGIWLMGSGPAPWQYTYLSSTVWFLAGFAYALGPAYQIEAIVRARNPWLGLR